MFDACRADVLLEGQHRPERVGCNLVEREPLLWCSHAPKTGGPQGCDSEGGLSQKGGENVRLFRMTMMNTTLAAYDDDLAQYRPRLFGIAFRMLGDVQDAEDRAGDDASLAEGGAQKR